MWIVIRYKKHEYSLLLNELKKKINNSIKLYIPKIKIKKFHRNKLIIKEERILNDYAFCYFESQNNSFFLKLIKSIKGIKQVFENCAFNQKEILEFINYCKKNSDHEGFIKNSFFDFSKLEKGIFLNGPFTNIFFKVLEVQKNKFKILVGNLTTTIKKETSYLYCQP